MILKHKGLIVSILSATLILSTITGCDKKLPTQGVPVPSNQSDKYINTADAEKTINIIKELTSPKYDGRLAGTEGNKLAGQYIIEQFKALGLENPKGLTNYSQDFKQKVLNINSKPVLQVKDSSGKIVKDYSYLQEFREYPVPSSKIKGTASAQLYVVKNASDINKDNKNLNNKILLISETLMKSLGYQRLTSSLSSLKVKGFIIEKDFKAPGLRSNKIIRALGMQPNTSFDDINGILALNCDNETYKSLEQYASSGQIVEMSIDFSYNEVTSSNIIGIIPGSDSSLKDEFIIIGAHFDHLGNNKNGTYNPGAFDNASGVSAMLEIARSIKTHSSPPKKSILFIAFNGEEEWLYGSEYYASYPLYPLDKAVMINMDMVGTKNVDTLNIEGYTKTDTKLRDDLYRYGKKLNINVVKEVETASDHASFATRGVEAINLLQPDFSLYHTSGDTIDCIGAENLKKVMDLVLYYVSQKAY